MSLLSHHELQALRRVCRGAREALTPQQQRQHGSAVAIQLAREPAFQRARRLGAYLAIAGELDPAQALDRARRMGKAVYVPRLRVRPQRKLWFLLANAGQAFFSPNRFGIREPPLALRQSCPPWALDLLLVPLVGFDPQGHRLGMGGGYYDRTLAYLRHRSHWRRPVLVGVAHQCQCLAALPFRPWDIPLDLVITETRVYRWQRTNRLADPSVMMDHRMQQESCS